MNKQNERKIIDELDVLLGYLLNVVPKSACELEIINDVFQGNRNIPTKAIILHLLDSKHIYECVSSDDDVFSGVDPRYSITVSGINFYLGAKIKNRPYYCQQHQIELDSKTKITESWQKRNWVMISIIALVFGLCGSLIGEWCKRGIWPEPAKAATPIYILKDSVVNTPLIKVSTGKHPH